MKEESEAKKDPDQEARDQQRGERFRKTDEDGGVGASHQDPKEGEGRRKGLAGVVARSAMWI
jgi:hypothetical protein